MKLPRAIEATRDVLLVKTHAREFLEAEIEIRGSHYASYMQPVVDLLTIEIIDLRRSLVEFQEDEDCNGV